MTAPLIGLYGRAGAGKDTFGQYLVERYNYRRFAFADKLKEMALDINPVLFGDWAGTYDLRGEVERYGGWDVAKRDWDVREFLQNLGSAVRKQDEWFWVDLIQGAVIAALDGDIPVVITDMRHPNEFDWVKDYSGLTVRIDRPGLVKLGHESEGALDGFDFDFTYINDGALSGLHMAARAAHKMAVGG